MTPRLLRAGSRPQSTASRVVSRRARAATPSTSAIAPPAEVKPQIQETPAYDTGPLSDILLRSPRAFREVRSGQYLHVSDLLYRCQRREAIVHLHNMPRLGASLSLSESLTFAQGDAIHDVMKQRAAAAAPAEVWGNWRCACKRLATVEPCTLSEAPADICEACGTGAVNYVEVPMIHEELGIVGTPDLILYKREIEAFLVTELKSIGPDKFSALVRPEPDHVLQVVFYWFLMQARGYPLADKVAITYASKGAVFRGSPLKEFVIDPLEVLPRLVPYQQEARALKAAKAGGKLPNRPCSDKENPEARKCDVCMICFAVS